MGAAAFEASSVAYGHGRSLDDVGEALFATQPEGTSGPGENHPGQLRVRCQGLEDLAGTRPTPTISTWPRGLGSPSFPESLNVPANT